MIDAALIRRPERLTSWLFRIARRRAADVFKQRARARQGVGPDPRGRAARRRHDRRRLDAFAAPGQTPDDDLASHCDGPPVLRRVAGRGDAPAASLRVAWLREDTPADAARAIGVHVRTIHDQVGWVIRRAQVGLGLREARVVLSWTHGAHKLVAPDVREAVIEAGVDASGAELARRHGLTPQQVSEIRREAGIVVPTRTRPPARTPTGRTGRSACAAPAQTGSEPVAGRTGTPSLGSVTSVDK